MQILYGDYGTTIRFSKTPKNSKACIMITQNGNTVDLTLKDLLKILSLNGVLKKITEINDFEVNKFIKDNYTIKGIIHI